MTVSLRDTFNRLNGDGSFFSVSNALDSNEGKVHIYLKLLGSKMHMFLRSFFFPFSNIMIENAKLGK